MSALLLSLFIFFSPANQQALPGKKLITGWHLISPVENEYKRSVDGKSYYINPQPVVMAKNIRMLTLEKFSDGAPYLKMQFDKQGTRAWSYATMRSVGGQIAFILNDKLLQAPIVNSQIDIGVAIIGSYTKAELLAFKEAIEKEK